MDEQRGRQPLRAVCAGTQMRKTPAQPAATARFPALRGRAERNLRSMKGGTAWKSFLVPAYSVFVCRDGVLLFFRDLILGEF